MELPTYKIDDERLIVSTTPETEQNAGSVRLSPHSNLIQCSSKCGEAVQAKTGYRESNEYSSIYDSESSPGDDSEVATIKPANDTPEISPEFIPARRPTKRTTSSLLSASCPQSNQPHRDCPRTDTKEGLEGDRFDQIALHLHDHLNQIYFYILFFIF